MIKTLHSLLIILSFGYTAVYGMETLNDNVSCSLRHSLPHASTLAQLTHLQIGSTIRSITSSWAGTPLLKALSTTNVTQKHTVAHLTTADITPDGKIIIAGFEDGAVHIWNTTPLPNQQKYIFKDHRSSIKSVAITPDGTRAVTGSSDCTVRIWNISNLKSIEVLATFDTYYKSISYVAISTDGTRITTRADSN